MGEKMVLGALLAGYSIGQLAIYLVAFITICGLVLIAVRKSEITIPEWFKHALWLIVLAFVIITGIRMVMSM